MASGLTRYTEKALLQHVFKISSMTVPSNIYIGLFTVAPGSTGGGTECPDGNYQRQQENNWALVSPDADPEYVGNSDVIEFPAMAASQAIVAIGVFDTLSGGNLIGWVTASFTAGIGVVVHFDIAALKIRMNYTA